MARKTAGKKSGKKSVRPTEKNSRHAEVSKPKRAASTVRGRSTRPADEQDTDTDEVLTSAQTRTTQSLKDAKKKSKSEPEMRTVLPTKKSEKKKTVPTRPVKVKATRTGYYGDILRKPGAKFVMHLTQDEIDSQEEGDEMDHSPSWIKILKDDKASKSQARKQREEEEDEDDEIDETGEEDQDGDEVEDEDEDEDEESDEDDEDDDEEL